MRVTESGLGCPDWPLCHGEVIPPYKFETLVEYSHRLIASLVAGLVLGILLVVWIKYRSERFLLYLSLAGLILVITQAVLGGITVLTELSGNVVTIHLALAQILLGLFTLIFFVIIYGSRSGAEIFNKHKWLLMTTITFVFVLLLSGSFTTTTGASGACDQWPLCQYGSILVNSKLPMIHMAHRVIAVAAGILIVLSMRLAWRTENRGGKLYLSSVVLGFVGVIQICIGAATVLFDLPAELKILHLFVATLMWWLTVIMLLLFYYYEDNPRVVGKLETR